VNNPAAGRFGMRKRTLKPWGMVGFVWAILFLPQLVLASTLYVGSISTEPAAEIKKFLPLASYIGKELRSEEIDRGKVVVARSIPEMAAFLREGKVDLYIDSPFPALAVSRLSGSKFLLRRWKKGIAEYHSVIFVRKESGVNQIENLRGKMIAFEEPFSSSGYFLPKLFLAQKGLKLAHKKDASEPTASGEVGYVFSNDDENTMVWVLRGKVAAGAMDNQNYEKEARGDLKDLKVIEKTFSLPRHIVSHRADLPAKLVARIKEILLRMDQSETGKKALHDFERTTKFDELSDASMEPLLKARKFIDAELGLK